MRHGIVGMVAICGLCAAASAQQIFDPNLITLQHDFEGFGAPPPGPFTLGNATFSEASTGSGGPGWRVLSGFFNGSDTLTDNAGISDITIDFDTPMGAAGLLVGIGPGTYDVSFYDMGGGLLGTVSGSVVDVTESFFAGWGHAGGIGSIRILEPTGDNARVGGIDDVRYDIVPAPGSLALLGLAGFAAARRRR